MFARRLIQALVLLHSAACWAAAVMTPPEIPEQPLIRAIFKWGDQIAVITEDRKRSQKQFAFSLSVVDPSSSRLVPFRGLDCDSYHDVGHDAGLGKLVLCGTGNSARVYRFNGQSWNPLTDSVQGTEFRFTVEGDRVAVVSESTVIVMSASSGKSLAIIPIKIEVSRFAPTTLLIADDALLVAYDHGEFGGGLYRIDLRWPEATPRRLIGENVSVLARAKSGAVWAAGGLSHLGGESASLYRVSSIDVSVVARIKGSGGIVNERFGVRYPGLTSVAGLTLGNEDRPTVIFPEFGVFELSGGRFVALYKGPLYFHYKMPNYSVGSGPVGLAVSDSGDIYIASRSLGVFVLRRNKDRYDFEQLIFDQLSDDKSLKLRQ